MFRFPSPLLVIAFYISFCFTILSCQGAPSKQTSPPTVATTTPNIDRETSSDLLWSEAQERKARLSKIVYDLKVDLTNGDLTAQDAKFSGDLILHFDLKNNSKKLRLDFFEGEVKSLEANGQLLPLELKKKYWIEIPSSALKEGANEISISFEQKYSKTGQGLHRFVDPEDQKVYLYTQFEPNDAQRFLPCFDQPDLRANFVLSVIAPKDWQVVSSVQETSKISLKKQNKDLWTFPPSPQIATYLFSLHAGPYRQFTDYYVRTNKEKIKLRLFVRPSLAKYLNSKEWFAFTKQGLKFYENSFGVAYPFGKYDQLIVPEFNMGGMENVAAITYSEWYVPRSEPTRRMRRGLAGLLLHEMAHMWFGDLVTMAWWNDLWLNESFATYMSSLAVANATEFKEEWQSFAAHTKRGAYVQDAMVTTHPIEATVTRVKEAMSTFDGITYNKGASVLKQLSYYMTEDAFQKGIQTYFKVHSYRNTTLQDFIKSLQGQTQKDLSLWADRWLRQSGTDQITANWKCSADGLSDIALTLTPTPGKKFRPQSLEVGLFKKQNGKIHLSEHLRADVTGPETLHLQGHWACPDFVYPNYGDHGYVNVKLDAKSLEVLPATLADIDDLLTRSMVWNDLWRMVRETELPLKKYIEIVATNFPTESDEIISQQVVSTISRPGSSVLYYWPTATDQGSASRLEFLKMMETDFFSRMSKAKSGSDEEKFWYDSFAAMAESPPAVEKLSTIYHAGKISLHFPLDIDRKWQIVRQLVRFDHANAKAALAEMKTLDPSDRGKKSALGIDAVTPNLNVKEKWIQELIKKDTQRPLQEVQTIMYSLFPREQQNLKLRFEKIFADYFEKNKSSEEELKTETILFGLLPINCDRNLSIDLKQRVGAADTINPNLKKSLLMSLDEDERCQRIRAAY